MFLEEPRRLATGNAATPGLSPCAGPTPRRATVVCRGVPWVNARVWGQPDGRAPLVQEWRPVAGDINVNLIKGDEVRRLGEGSPDVTKHPQINPAC